MGSFLRWRSKRLRLSPKSLESDGRDDCHDGARNAAVPHRGDQRTLEVHPQKTEQQTVARVPEPWKAPVGHEQADELSSREADTPGRRSAQHAELLRARAHDEQER